MTEDAERLTRFAKAMRREPVANERALWKLLRDRRLDGLKFRRQVPIGRYIVDFVCFQHRLIIEADGPTHLDNLHDRERDNWLRAEGFRVLRFDNRLIERDPWGCWTRSLRPPQRLLLPLREKVSAKQTDEGFAPMRDSKGLSLLGYQRETPHPAFGHLLPRQDSSLSV